jgi:hypothetical protein
MFSYEIDFGNQKKKEIRKKRVETRNAAAALR